MVDKHNEDSRPRIVVVGAGAAGSLTVLHLLRGARARQTSLEVVLVDPAERWARGAAFGTRDDLHLLNVPASGMSALPDDPGHFARWRETHGHTDGYAFAPRAEFSRYVDELLTDEVEQSASLARVEHVHDRAVAVDRSSDDRLRVVLAAGEELPADAVVVAPGLPSVGVDWAPPALLESPRFVADPWAPGALDAVRGADLAGGPADVLVVGTGLTMVDVALTLGGDADADSDSAADRLVHAVSRSGLLPETHAPAPLAAVVPDISAWGDHLPTIREQVLRHVVDTVEATGDWRPAMDGLRHHVADLWQRLGQEDREAFLREDAARWNRYRHRVPTASASRIDQLVDSGALTIEPGHVVDVEPLPSGGLRVTLPGRTRDVGWVVNCTGPRNDIRTLADPLVDDLLRDRPDGALAVADVAGLGVRTHGGRLLDAAGRIGAPVWTLGAMRRGELWESTAVPEIRVQALEVATAVLEALAVAS